MEEDVQVRNAFFNACAACASAVLTTVIMAAFPAGVPYANVSAQWVFAVSSLLFFYGLSQKKTGDEWMTYAAVSMVLLVHIWGTANALLLLSKILK